MTLFQDTAGGPRTDAALYGDVLAFYGAAGDAAMGHPRTFAARKAATAVSIAKVAQLDAQERHALYYAGLLHAVGSIGNPAFRKGEHLSERMARIESWDVPADGARACAQLRGIPKATPDTVRWQSECWDGTGYPDQLRWHGIPKTSVVLALADACVRASDPEEALTAVAMQSGRAYGPEMARMFTMWFHLTGGEGDNVDVPLEALEDVERIWAEELLDDVATRVDAHNGCEERWRRLARLCDATAGVIGLDDEQRMALGIAARVCGAGEMTGDTAAPTPFDPLARLGIDQRAVHAAAAADIVESIPALRCAAPVLRARAEWFDGTGKPRGLFHGAIPDAAGVLAAVVAYDALDHKDRIDTAAGTQFDPRVVRAVLEAAKVGT